MAYGQKRFEYHTMSFTFRFSELGGAWRPDPQEEVEDQDLLRKVKLESSDPEDSGVN